MKQTQVFPRVGVARIVDWKALGAPLAIGLLLVAGLWRVDGPPLWWDEGWTLTVARTWVERGHYGRLLNGEIAPAGLEAAFPTTVSVALSFKLFGIGVWQGRLPGVLYTTGALLVLYQLARQLYSRRVAWATLGGVLLMAPHVDLHALTVGRQVLAEMPMLCLLLSGYLCLLLALQRSRWFLAPAVMLWSIALVSKAQPYPFWLASLLVPLTVTWVRHQWRVAAVLVVCLFGTWAVQLYLPSAFFWLIQGRTLPGTPLSGLHEIVAVVQVARTRSLALQLLLFIGLPLLLGLCSASWAFLRQRLALDSSAAVVRLALLVLCGTWVLWYALFSLGIPRYLFPALFVGAIFVAALLDQLTVHFSLQHTLHHAAALLHPRRFKCASAGAWIALLLVGLFVPPTLGMLRTSYLGSEDSGLAAAASFLNSATPPDALIESYDSELFFLLDRKYHYPPDQYHVELLRQAVTGAELTAPYDPLPSDPDYLVVKQAPGRWQPYAHVLATNAFQPLRQFGRYQVYVRADTAAR